MAAAATSADGMGVSKSGRALAFATSFTICLFAAGALAITLFGRGHGPPITLDLPERPPDKAMAAAALTAAPPVDAAPVSGPITKPAYAGQALLADPALIENTKEGPLPRVAEDGREPVQAYAA